jgi:N-acyl homoserine lactone hydrolase
MINTSSLASGARVTLFALATTVAGLTGCKATGHAATPSSLGVASTSSALDAVVDQPGPVTVETVIGADWVVARSGLINLDHPAAKAAHLVDGDEPILIMFHALRHPTQGLFLVDSGVEGAFRTDPDHAVVHGLVGSLAHVDRMKVRVDTAAWVATQPDPVRGVLLTHLHLDHVLGLRDLPATTPVYVGPGDAEEKGFMNLFTAGIADRALENKGPLAEMHFTPDPAGEFDGVLDLFGDGTVWALWVPGHTPGSVAYLVRTPKGPVLLTGDACHTAWGWQNGVEPGTFSADGPKGAASLAKLRAFVGRHPQIDVRLGHQELPRATAGAGAQ